MSLEQWQELCEWAGFSWLESYHQGTYYDNGQLCNRWSSAGWLPPDGRNEFVVGYLPPQDMNTLFHWMVPKLMTTGVGTSEDILSTWIWSIVYEQIDPFEALAQAIYKVVKDV